ncbi:MAG: gliding motility lipoprotein GldJ [Bacteroidales bacterium]|jgi:sulfatase modifying factor 1|nr:gliding motility lipoprotein GldJ [Bacteroidales bacterium]
MKIQNLLVYSLIVGMFVITGCADEVSPTTGWNYNDSDNGGFEKYDDFYEQETGPGLVLVEGGSFMMGGVQEDFMYDWNNLARKVTVSSFYMDETEVRNIDYREYLYWIKRVFPLSENPYVYWKALPDTLVWRKKLAYNEPYVQHYLRHPAYQNYPVVGVDWLQASDYCIWRTDRVNEQILIREGVLNQNPDQAGQENFNVESYMQGLYEGSVKQNLNDYNPNSEERIVREEDGILLPKYRLPTEAEWEFAALALIGNSVDERIYERKIYPWNGHQLRNPEVNNRGKMMANFTRGRGDQMGVAGRLNDGADVTAPVLSYWPNDYGLYCMAGNVNEWVLDVYRELSFTDVDEFRPFRGTVFEKYQLGPEGQGSFAERDSLGRMQKESVTPQDAFGRMNYRKADNINYKDGDKVSSVAFSENIDTTTEQGKMKMNQSNLMYQQQNLDWENDYVTYEEDGRDEKQDQLYAAEGWYTLVNDHSRVYKGGSWRDRAYYLSPGSRRFLDEKKAKDDLGFRCAMTRVGSPSSF